MGEAEVARVVAQVGELVGRPPARDGEMVARRLEVLAEGEDVDADALDVIFAARPDVLNHNLETVARLQRTARPSAHYFRSLALLARAKDAGLVTKSGIILGMGEEWDEILTAMRDLRRSDVNILTLGQYLRPTDGHLPVVRFYTPAEFEELRDAGLAMGFTHVQASPLTRSSYHAWEQAKAAGAGAPENEGIS